MNTKKIEQKTYELLEDYLATVGYEVVLIEFLRDHKGWVLRIFIDTESGVTIEDCTKVSELIEPLLDVEDFIKTAYSLEVSSPGVNRPLRKPEHFQKVIGETVKIVLSEPMEGNRKNFKGKLLKTEENFITVKTDNEIFNIDINNIKKANLIYNF